MLQVRYRIFNILIGIGEDISSPDKTVEKMKALLLQMPPSNVLLLKYLIGAALRLHIIEWPSSFSQHSRSLRRKQNDTDKLSNLSWAKFTCI